MRKSVIKGVAKALEKESLAKECQIGFNLALYHGKANALFHTYKDQTKHHCGTVACIAGWTVVLYRKDGELRKKPLVGKAFSNRFSRRSTDDEADGDKIMNDAASAMDITIDDAFELFEPCIDKNAVTPQQAAKVLRKFAKTGKIDWSECA